MRKRLLSILLAGVLVLSQAGGVLAAENTAADGTSAEISESEEPGGEDSGAEEAEGVEAEANAADMTDGGGDVSDDGVSDAAETSGEDDEDVTAPGGDQAPPESEEYERDGFEGEEAAGDVSESEESGESSTAPAVTEETVEEGQAVDAANAQDEINGGFFVEIRDYDAGHRLFEDGVWSCPIEVRGPVALDYSLTMTVPEHNGPQDADVLSACRLEANEMRLYIDGGRLKEEGVTWFKLRISAVLEGEESGEPCEREFTVDKPYIERQFGFGDRSLLPGWTQWIDRKHGCYVENGQYPFGNHFDLTVTDISVVDIEGEDVALIEFSDENGWEIRAKNAGVSKVTVSYPDFRYLGFWHKPKTDAPYVCVEPWTSLPSREGIVEDLSLQSDRLHFDAHGAVDLGRRVFARMKAVGITGNDDRASVEDAFKGVWPVTDKAMMKSLSCIGMRESMKR